MRLQPLSQEGGGNDNPLQYSCLKNSIDRGDWTATDQGITKRKTQLIMHACMQMRVEASLVTYHYHDFYHSVICSIPKSHQSSLVPNMPTGRSV